MTYLIQILLVFYIKYGYPDYPYKYFLKSRQHQLFFFLIHVHYNLITTININEFNNVLFIYNNKYFIYY
jgi:hypothetical protein